MNRIHASIAHLSLALGLFAATAMAAPSTWVIDPVHSSVSFKVKHMMISNVVGNFTKFSGTIDADEADLSKSKVNVSIDISSITTGVDARDNHLKSPDFFDVAKFPTMTFVSKSVKVISKDKLEVTGDLTMHGVTKSVVLAVDGPTDAINAMGHTERGASATTKISRKDFGLTWNKAIEAGGVAVGDEVTISLELELTKK